jgi:hypothetical protein
VEFLFEILAEFVLQIVFEILVDIGLHALREGVHPTRPILSTVGTVLWGVIAGTISLWPYPHSLITHTTYRVANLIITPLAAGVVMMLLGRFQKNRGRIPLWLDHFGHGAIFALSMALMRYFFAL